MRNAANDPNCDTYIVTELEEAGIGVLNVPWGVGGEVPSKCMGVLNGWTLMRAWRYWIAEAEGGTLLPFALADALYATHGTVVRVAGDGTCPEPRWIYTQPWDLGVPLYHIDTQEGLNAWAAAVRRVGEPDYLLTGHKCRPVARMHAAAGRDVWLGELTKPLADWPTETHCLHIKTPLKEVVLGVNIGDMAQLAVFAQIVNGGAINSHWLDQMELGLRRAASPRLLPGEDDTRPSLTTSPPRIGPIHLTRATKG